MLASTRSLLMGLCIQFNKHVLSVCSERVGARGQKDVQDLDI